MNLYFSFLLRLTRIILGCSFEGFISVVIILIFIIILEMKALNFNNLYRFVLTQINNTLYKLFNLLILKKQIKLQSTKTVSNPQILIQKIN